jgi:Transposase DDE domain
MLPSIVQAIVQIKRNVAERLTAASIVEACRESQYHWRQRELGPAQTVWAFMMQVLHGNAACEHVVRLAQLPCTGSAYCAARARLPLAVLRLLVERTCQTARGSQRCARWHGHRTFFADGTSFSMPDAGALRDHFGQPGQQQRGCGFPVAHLLAMFDAATGLLISALAAPLRTHDMSQVAQLHPELQTGDVLVADRGFASYAHLALLLQRKLHAVLRVHQRQLVSFRRDRRLSGQQPRGTVAKVAASRLIRKLARYDQIVDYVKPTTCPVWLDQAAYAALPETIRVRELRYRTRTRGCRTRTITLVATLLDGDEYPLKEVAGLYRRRWEIETNLAHLKTTMGMDVLHCRSVEGVLKELTMFALIYNLARLVMLAAAREQSKPLAQLSFVDALRWLAEACHRQVALQLHVNPARPNRLEPRVRKRRPKEYPLMKQPRCQLRQPLLRQAVTH